MRLIRAIDTLSKDLGYFVFFIEIGEIRDRNILKYYADRVDDAFLVVSSIASGYPAVRNIPGMFSFLNPIFKYRKLVKEARMKWFDGFLDDNKNIEWDDKRIRIRRDGSIEEISWDDFGKEVFSGITWDDLMGEPDEAGSGKSNN